MNTVSRHIQYLAARHDCVVVPGLGGILATREAAADCQDGGYTAPRRRFTFNATLSHNDGLLACSIARAMDISYDSALRLIEKEVADIRRQLESDGEYPIGTLGYFSEVAGEDGVSRIEFTPFAEDSLSVDTFWLPRIQTATGASVSKPDAEKPEPKEIRLVRYRRLREFARTAAVIVAVFAFYCLVSNPIAVDSTVYASLAPEFQKTEAAEMLPTEAAEMLPTDIVADEQGGNDAAKDTNREAAAEAAQPEAPSPSHTHASAQAPEDVPEPTTKEPEAEVYTPVDEGGDYCVIVASLATEEQASEYLAQPGHRGMHMLEAGGRYRIYTTSHPTAARAQKALNAVAGKYPGAWVCHK